MSLKGRPNYELCFKTNAPWCCYSFIISHSICFYSVNDYSGCSTGSTLNLARPSLYYVVGHSELVVLKQIAIEESMGVSTLYRAVRTQLVLNLRRYEDLIATLSFAVLNTVNYYHARTEMSCQASV